MKSLQLLGLPVDCGSAQAGCVMGPDAYRIAGILDALTGLGHAVEDCGTVATVAVDLPPHPNPAVRNIEECVGWVTAIMDAAYASASSGAVPVFLGGDHLLSAGTVPGVARASAERGRPQFVLWLDAHTDFHTPATTTSGNLHGTPVAYFTGQPGFAPHFPEVPAPVACENVLMIGLRSVDPAERVRLAEAKVHGHDMRAIDEHGILPVLRAFLDRVRAADGALHVSLDVDFLDPVIAPAVGTTVPGGATFREAHLIMETLCDADLVTSLDLAELNPFLDTRGQTARLMVDLVASLFGRRILDRPTAG